MKVKQKYAEVAFGHQEKKDLDKVVTYHMIWEAPLQYFFDLHSEKKIVSNFVSTLVSMPSLKTKTLLWNSQGHDWLLPEAGYVWTQGSEANCTRE